MPIYIAIWRLRPALLGVAATLILCATAGALTETAIGGPILRADDRVAVCGDSITEQKIYSVYIEDYLLMCQPVSGVQTLQCGWSGATAGHFAGHMKFDVVTLHPTVATTSYGMNDGGYDRLNKTSADAYRDALTRIVAAFKAGDTRVLILGSPGVVDSHYFKNPHHADVSAADYNQTLGQLGEVAREVAAANGVLFADVHSAMMDGMARAKAAFGDDYPVAGDQDGVHGGPPGHLLMAYAYLKAMGVDGNIGTITFDMATNAATASDGHRILSVSSGEIKVESTRYPFCFFAGNKDGDKADALIGTDNWNWGNAAILRCCPFNQDLNRFMLVVTNLKLARAKVTWGEESKVFTAEQLAKGINLAAEFLKGPFAKPFMQVHRMVQDKEAFETLFIKEFLSNKERGLLQALPSREKAIKSVETNFRDIEAGFLEDCTQAVQPVTHTIKIEELQ